MRQTPWIRREEIPQGFTSRARAYRNTTTQALPASINVPVYFNAESYDGKGEFVLSTIAGTADATEALKLHDADGGFAASNVGDFVWNTTDGTYATVSAFVDSGELTLDTDIMANGEAYILYKSRFIATEAGYYLAVANIRFDAVEDGKRCFIGLYVGATLVAFTNTYQSVAGAAIDPAHNVADIVSLGVGDYLYVKVLHDCSAAKAVLFGSDRSFLSIHRLS